MLIYVGLRGLGAAAWLGAVVAGGLGVAGCVFLARRLPDDLDGLARTKRWWCIAWLLGSVLALAQTARMSAFMLDPATQQAQSLERRGGATRPSAKRFRPGVYDTARNEAWVSVGVDHDTAAPVCGAWSFSVSPTPPGSM